MARRFFHQLDPVTLPERAANALKDAFFTGRLKPGDFIGERETARQMRVGTAVVREALISLREQGFVRRVANTGTFVTQFSAEELRQLNHVRVELELLALQWARNEVAETDLARLQKTTAKMTKAAESRDRCEFLECVYSFRQHCWRLSGNKYLSHTLHRLTAPFFAFAFMSCGEPLDALVEEHERLIAALRHLEEPEFTVTVRAILSRDYRLAVLSPAEPTMRQ
ncbi:MAG TPA: GntR family transcriptional regulator [Bryobacteraceae bacterium]|nr:GntR family transcriptional regulator [Bryobacteraceae bacterium]